MIRSGIGDLLKAPTQALVNTVNTEGVMGKGIALQFKRAYPEMFKAYRDACAHGLVQLGQMWVWQTASLDGPRLIINFPTKGHWRSASRLTDIHTGLIDLMRVIDEYRIESIAVPPLGCGNGGLKWADVRPEIERAFTARPDVDVHLFSPDGAPVPSAMTTRTARPQMTRAKAALVSIIRQYSAVAFGATLIEVQKLMYFLQEAGEPLKLKYVKGRYGPYADNLNHLLKGVEGHFVVGFGDGSRPALSNEVLTVYPEAVPEASREVERSPDLSERIDRVMDLVDGFESAYNLELLSTVHWVCRADDHARLDPTVALRHVQAWSPRKHGLFGQADTALAWQRLHECGWLAARPTALV